MQHGFIMPWSVNDLMSVRMEFVQLASQPEANVRQLCRRYGISPTVGYKWLERFEPAPSAWVRSVIFSSGLIASVYGHFFNFPTKIKPVSF